MSLPQKLLWHTFGLGAAGLLARTATVIVGFVIARHFGPQEFGRYATALALAMLFLSLSQIGVSYRLMKLASRNDKHLDIEYGNTLLTTGILAISLYPTLIITARVLGYPAATQRLVWLLGLTVTLLSLHEVFSAVAQGRQLMGRISVYRAAYGVSLLVIVAVVILLDGSVEVFCAAALLFVLGLTVSWYLSTNRLVTPRLAPKRIPAMLRDSYLYGLSGFLFIIHLRVDTLMLSLMRSEVEVGEYNAAYQVVELLIKAPILVSFVTMPLAFAVADERARTMHLYTSKLRHLGVLGGIATLALLFLAEPIVSTTVGVQYREAPAALQALSLVMLAKFLAVPTGDTLTALDRQGIRTAIQGFVAIVNIGANLVLIPKFGIVGAAWATVTSEMLLTLGYYVGLKLVWGGSEGFSALLVRFAVGFIISGLVAAVANQQLGRLGAAFCGCLALVAWAYAVGILRSSDFKSVIRAK